MGGLHRLNVGSRDRVIGVVSDTLGHVKQPSGHHQLVCRDLFDRDALSVEVCGGIKVRADVLTDVDPANEVPIGGNGRIDASRKWLLTGPRCRSGSKRLGKIDHLHRWSFESVRALPRVYDETSERIRRASTSASSAVSSPPSMRASSASTPASLRSSIVVSVGSPGTLSTR